MTRIARRPSSKLIRGEGPVSVVQALAGVAVSIIKALHTGMFGALVDEPDVTQRIAALGNGEVRLLPCAAESGARNVNSWTA